GEERFRTTAPLGQPIRIMLENLDAGGIIDSE
ncbi:unnamed protein product, partial [marine sediment metagenome]